MSRDDVALVRARARCAKIPPSRQRGLAARSHLREGDPYQRGGSVCAARLGRARNRKLSVTIWGRRARTGRVAAVGVPRALLCSAVRRASQGALAGSQRLQASRTPVYLAYRLRQLGCSRTLRLLAHSLLRCMRCLHRAGVAQAGGSTHALSIPDCSPILLNRPLGVQPVKRGHERVRSKKQYLDSRPRPDFADRRIHQRYERPYSRARVRGRGRSVQ